MSISVLRQAELDEETKSILEVRLLEYYSEPSESYYQIADQAADQYLPEIQPFHCDLANRVAPGMTVLELGCGTAHLCSHVEARGASYTGMDHSAELLERDRRRFPRARFLPIGAQLREKFDVVASLYTIEHVVDPPAYLEKMWRFSKPDGLIAIICPDFVDGDGFPPSFYYGRTPRRFREKVRCLAFADACEHLFDLFWFAPRWKARARSTPPGAFWINVKPRLLFGVDYSIDSDAVHLPRLHDLVWWLERHGASIVATSRSLAHVDPSILKHNCYVVARRRVE